MAWAKAFAMEPWLNDPRSRRLPPFIAAYRAGPDCRKPDVAGEDGVACGLSLSAFRDLLRVNRTMPGLPVASSSSPCGRSIVLDSLRQVVSDPSSR